MSKDKKSYASRILERKALQAKNKKRREASAKIRREASAKRRKKLVRGAKKVAAFMITGRSLKKKVAPKKPPKKKIVEKRKTQSQINKEAKADKAKSEKKYYTPPASKDLGKKKAAVKKKAAAKRKAAPKKKVATDRQSVSPKPFTARMRRKRKRKVAVKKAPAKVAKKKAPAKKKYLGKYPGIDFIQKARRKKLGIKAGEKAGRVGAKAKKAVKTKGGTYIKYEKESKSAQSFRDAFKQNCKGDSKGFSWQGRKYSCERPKQS